MIKKIFFGTLIGIAFGAASFAFTLMQDPCDIKYLHAKIEKRLERNAKRPHLQDQFNDMKRIIKELQIPKEKEKAAMISMAKYAVLVEKNCPIPTEIKKEFYFYTLGQQDTGTKHCALNTFKEKARKQLIQIMKHPKLHAKLERETLQNTLQEVEKSAHLKNHFLKKWQDQGYKNTYIIAALQTSLREEHNCIGTNVPLIPITDDLIKNGLQKQ